MQLNLESNDKHAIQAYSSHQLKINNQFIDNHVLVDRDTIITPWQVLNSTDLNVAHFAEVMSNQPEIILIGCDHTNSMINPQFRHYLAEKRIAIEIMAIGAACRTYNVLLSEHRHVVLGVLF